MNQENVGLISLTGGPSAANHKKAKLMGSVFHLDQRYTLEGVLGTGAYGMVVSARDTLTGEKVAIKKIEKAFEHLTFAKRTLRELKILRLLDHENIISIKSIQLPKSRGEFQEIYAINEIMDTDLSTVIRSPQALTDEHSMFFLYQILRGVKYMHSAKILHRDLKPRNLLVNSNCDLKICDFGLARPYFNELKVRPTQMTDYVATRWYRAPELLLNYKRYTSAMDMWSIGAIFGELLMRKPIFPGNDASHQLELIFSLLGTPSDEEIQAIPQPKAKEKVLRIPHKTGKPFDEVFSGCNPDAIDLLKKMLSFSPDKRITIEDALNHPYLSELHVEEDEPVAEPVSIFDFEFEQQVLNMEQLKNLIFDEILLYHFPENMQQYEDMKTKYNREMGMPARRYSRDVELSGTDDEVN